MSTDDDGRLQIRPPYTDPRGLGFTATLTEVFGMPTSLDTETQSLVDERNTLAQLPIRSDDQNRQLIALNDRLRRLGFMFEDREPLYQDFLQAWRDVRYSSRAPLTPDQLERRRKAMSALIGQLLSQREGAA